MTPPRSAHFRVSALLLVLTAAACDSDGADPRARTVTITPQIDNGAAVVLLVGAPISTVTSGEADVFVSTSGDTTRVVLLREVPGPLRFDVLLEDATLDPVGTVLQVSDGENALRADVNTYRVEVNP